MSTRNFVKAESLKSSLKICIEEAAWIKNVLLPNRILCTAIDLYNIARSRGWGRAEELALQCWRKLSQERLASLVEETRFLYRKSPSRTPERKAALAALRRLSGKKLSKEEFAKLQEGVPKILPRRSVRVYCAGAW